MPASPHLPARLPILVLTGFLGSGKTTLLNRMLREWPRSAVLINEFGETPVDHRLLEQQNLPLMTLSGGCLCCQIRGTLAPVLKNLRMAWGQPDAPEFERVILETSGVASPEPVLDTLLRDHWLASRYRLLGIVATLSAPAAREQIERFPEAQAQAAWADVLVLTQTDLAEPAEISRLDARLDGLAPATPRVRAVQGGIEPDALLASIGFGYRRVPDGSDRPAHGFRSLSLHLRAAVAWPLLSGTLERLLERHGARLVRIKGVVRVPDRYEPVAVQGAAGRLFLPLALPARAGDDGLGRLVFITDGVVEGLAEELLLELGGGSARWH